MLVGLDTVHERGLLKCLRLCVGRVRPQVRSEEMRLSGVSLESAEASKVVVEEGRLPVYAAGSGSGFYRGGEFVLIQN